MIDWCNVPGSVIITSDGPKNLVCRDITPSGPAYWILDHFGPMGLFTALFLIVIFPVVALEILKKRYSVSFYETFKKMIEADYEENR